MTTERQEPGAMDRQAAVEAILDLLGRPEEGREKGRANLAALSDDALQGMLDDAARDAEAVAAAVAEWTDPAKLKP